MMDIWRFLRSRIYIKHLVFPTYKLVNTENEYNSEALG